VVFLVNRLTKGRAADAAFELILFVCCSLMARRVKQAHLLKLIRQQKMVLPTS
jgi:hypothetical protein